MVPAVRKKLFFFSKGRNVLGEFPQSSGTSKHFSLKNQKASYMLSYPQFVLLTSSVD